MNPNLKFFIYSQFQVTVWLTLLDDLCIPSSFLMKAMLSPIDAVVTDVSRGILPVQILSHISGKHIPVPGVSSTCVGSTCWPPWLAKSTQDTRTSSLACGLVADGAAARTLQRTIADTRSIACHYCAHQAGWNSAEERIESQYPDISGYSPKKIHNRINLRVPMTCAIGPAVLGVSRESFNLWSQSLYIMYGMHIMLMLSTSG